MEEKRHGGPLTYRRRKKKKLTDLNDDVLLHTLKYFDAYNFVTLYKTNAHLRHLIDDFPILTDLLKKHRIYIDDIETRQKSRHLFAILLELTFYKIAVTITDTQTYPYDPDTKDNDLLNALKEHAIKKYSEVTITTRFLIFIDDDGSLYITKNNTYQIEGLNEKNYVSNVFTSIRGELNPVVYFPTQTTIIVREIVKGEFTDLYEENVYYKTF